ncbi:non-ribosomal peptide synthetase [Nocardia jinanensis]|uniref:Non-ribosomal peptide synthetase n=1 Tax=Nocardia jinanensis TaxID=382504 RepID=A0A917VRL5_9NOCA|nr:non-ribosomal peptide synthetase [Nocardia jinanensis]GGL10882.1 non-ribosomal peptide synthetase [Nocardia jinanensis]
MTQRPDGAFELTAAQRGILYAQQLAPAPITIAHFVEIEGDLDTAALSAAIVQEARESGYRCLRLGVADGEPYQVVEEAVGDAVSMHDLRDSDDPEAAAREWMRAEYTAPLDVFDDRLSRMAVLRVSSRRYFWYGRAHHIVQDGYAATRTLQRVAQLYTALVEGVPPPPTPFGELAAVADDDRAYRNSPEVGADREYWRRHLAGAPDPAGLAGRSVPPPAHPRVVGSVLSPRITELLERVTGGRRGVASAPVLVAAFGAFVARMLGRDEVLLTLPVTARTTKTLRSSGGMAANAVPLRVPARPDDTVGQLVRATRHELVHALPRQRYRMEDVLRDTGRNAGTPGSFGPHVNLMMFNGALDVGSLIWRLHVLSTGLVEDLSLVVYSGSGDDGVRLDLQANPGLYSDAEVQQHYRRFVLFLERFLVAGSDAALTTIDILTDAERATLLRARQPDAAILTLPDIFVRAAATNPASVAVRFEGRSVTYAELDERSNRLARTLIRYGAGPETAVASALTRSVESIVTLWAIVKTGAMYVPIDPNYPAARIAHLLADSETMLGVTVTDLCARLPQSVHWVVLDDDSVAPVIDAEPAAAITQTDRPAPLRPDHAAYLIYTSGSTGIPKGVTITHTGSANLLRAKRECMQAQSDARVLHFASPSFDASVAEILLAFGAGACLVVVPSSVLGGRELADIVAAEKVTHMLVTPSLLSTMDPAALASVGMLAVAGEALRPEVAQRYAGLGLRNHYGPTEFTIWATCSDVLDDGRPITIGSPLRGATALVLDRWLRPVPAGVVGELYLAGAGLARGYHHRADLTSSRFVAGLFGGRGERMYRTGDLACWNDTGSLEFRGRTDNQVKIRGFRIELDEIDAVLARDPDVEFATTVGHDGPGDATTLVSYVQPAPDAEIDVDRLRDAAAQVLPTYMVPATVVILEQIPLTPAGKLDRAALPKPEFRSGRAKFRPATTPTEQKVADACAEVLGIERVGIDESFIELGGNSLTAARLAADLGTMFGKKVSVMHILADVTVQALARRLDAEGDAPDSSPFAVLLPIRPAGTEPPLFCLHPTSGLAWCYTGLAAHLDSRVPIYGLQSPWVDDAEPRPRTIDEFADRYTQAVRSVQGDGPYRLLGWSLGGIVAHAVAARLRDLGAEVSLLALLDADTAFLDAEPPAPLSVAGFIAEYAGALGIDSAPAGLSTEDTVTLIQDRRGATFLEPRHLERMVAAAHHTGLMLAQHRPPVVDAAMIYFAAAPDGITDRPNAAASWTRYVDGPVHNHPIDAGHDDMMSAAVIPAIAQVLNKHL